MISGTSGNWGYARVLELILEYINCWFNLIEEIPMSAVHVTRSLMFKSVNSTVIPLLSDTSKRSH